MTTENTVSAASQPSTAAPAPAASAAPAARKVDVPAGLWMKCDKCGEMLFKKTVTENLEVCPKCDMHFRVGARQRVTQLLDEGSFEPYFENIHPSDPLEFKWAGKVFADRIAAEQKRTGETEAIQAGVGYIKGRRIAIGVMDGSWLMGTLGSVVGERLAGIIELATAEKLPLLIACMSGGARMHEGAISLMQMAKTSAALARYDRDGGFYMSLLTNPTTGGTTASFAMLGDVILAEPEALIGFAGQRVIANTIKAELPEGFQRSEFLLEHGYIDRIIHRRELRTEIARLIDFASQRFNRREKSGR